MRGNYTFSADIYSFACIMWEILTHEDLYSGMHAMEIAVGVLEKGLRPKITAAFPVGLVKIMTKCWDENPAERIPFTELVYILKDVQAELNLKHDIKARTYRTEFELHERHGDDFDLTSPLLDM